MIKYNYNPPEKQRHIKRKTETWFDVPAGKRHLAEDRRTIQ